MFSGGIRLCRLFGTEILLHPLWFLLLAVFVLPSLLAGQVAAAATITLFLIFLYASVIGHEFAHIFVGRWYGIQTEKVIINFFGGAAMMERIPFGIPESNIGMAGPLFSYVLGVLLSLPFWCGVPHTSFVLDFIYQVGYINLFLGLFNTLPIFPMDGGRILRGVLFHFNRKIVLSTKIVMIVGFCVIPIAFVTLIPPTFFSIIIVGLIIKMCLDEYNMVKMAYKDVSDPNKLDPLRVSQCEALIYVFGPDSKDVVDFIREHTNPEFDRVIIEKISAWRLLDPLDKRKLQIETLHKTMRISLEDAARMSRDIKLPGVGDD